MKVVMRKRHMAQGAGRMAKRGKIKNGKISGFKGVAKSQRFGRLYIEAECKAISGMTMRLIQARYKP